jgi:transketolase
MHHVSHKVPGVEFSTGALGHGLPFGVGKALAAQRLGRGWKTFVVLSDGELDEGSNWEALMFAAHHRLSNLVAIIDYNKLQSLAPVSQTLALEPLADKLKAFGCEVQEVDGHQHGQLKEALTAPATSQPRVVLAHTTKGQGVDFMRDKVQWHYKTPDADQLKSALTAKKTKLQAATDDQVYDIIDTMMTRIAKAHGISGQKLHDMWVKKYGEIPDTWIMKENFAEIQQITQDAFEDGLLMEVSETQMREALHQLVDRLINPYSK